MAGLGRRTHYRKHLTDQVLYDFPEPQDNEKIAKVVATRGGNQFDVVLMIDKDDDHDPTTRTPRLAILPTKFRKLVWVKRNDYVIVEAGDFSDDDDENGGRRDEMTTGSIRLKITHILYKDQVQHLIARGLWPNHDVEFLVEAKNIGDKSAPTNADGIVYDATSHHDTGPLLPSRNDSDTDDDGVYEGSTGNDNDDDLIVNTNRIGKMALHDSSSSDDDDDDDK